MSGEEIHGIECGDASLTCEILGKLSLALDVPMGLLGPVEGEDDPDVMSRLREIFSVILDFGYVNPEINKQDPER